MANLTINSLYNSLFEFYGDPQWWPTKFGSYFEVAVGAILTQNTAWKNVEKALENMQQKKIWNWEALLALDDKDLQQIIKPAGYYRTKSKKLKIFAEKVVNYYGQDFRKFDQFSTQKLRADLLGIWGIGNETADDIILFIANRPIFIIDNYTIRILSRTGVYVSNQPKSRMYEDYQTFIMKNFLQNDVKSYQIFHALLDIHANRICKKNPLCNNCILKESCKFAKNLSTK